MKLLAIACVFCGCILGGFWLDGDQKKRINELEKFAFIFELLKAEIDYRLTPLREACRIVGKRGNHEYIEKVMLYFSEKLEAKESVQIEEMWQEALASQKNNLHLNREDYKKLDSFGSACGYLDKNMEKRNIEMVLACLNKQTSEAKEKYERTSKLNRSLGVLVGLGISIFLL